jgi:hypothetical protein
MIALARLFVATAAGAGLGAAAALARRHLLGHPAHDTQVLWTPPADATVPVSAPSAAAPPAAASQPAPAPPAPAPPATPSADIADLDAARARLRERAAALRAEMEGEARNS